MLFLTVVVFPKYYIQIFQEKSIEMQKKQRFTDFLQMFLLKLTLLLQQSVAPDPFTDPADQFGQCAKFTNTHEHKTIIFISVDIVFPFLASFRKILRNSNFYGGGCQLGKKSRASGGGRWLIVFSRRLF